MKPSQIKMELHRLADKYLSANGVTLPCAPRLDADHYLDLYRAWQNVSDVTQVAQILEFAPDEEGAAVLAELLQEPQDFIVDMAMKLDLHVERGNLRKKPVLLKSGRKSMKQNIENTEITIRFIGVDHKTRKRFTTGGVQLAEGKPPQRLFSSQFDDSELHEKLEKQAGGPLA